MSTPQPQPGPLPSPTRAEHCRFFLTADCKCVQEELLDLASSAAEAALSEFGELKTSLLRALRAIREHLHRHEAEVSGRAGLFEYLAESSPQLDPDLDTLRQEHTALGACLDELERRLVELDPGVPAALTELRRCADRLAALTRLHQASACRLADDAVGTDPSSSQR